MKPVRKNPEQKPRLGRTTKRGAESRWLSSLRLQGQSLNSSLLRLLRAPFTSAIAITVMAIAIALAGSFYLLVNNAQQLVNSLQTGKQISLFLQHNISDDQARLLAQKLQANAAIAKISVISKEQALAEFQQYSGFGAALNALESNPLPAVIQVYPQDSLTEAYQFKQLLKQLQHEQAVDFAQMDMQWLARLQAIMQMANSVVFILTALLAVAVLFIIGNTIRSELQSRRDEVIVTKLVGGTNTFICLPFLYTGFWYGFISGLVAWCVISVMLLMLNAPLEQLALLYQSQFALQFMSFSETIVLLMASSTLGIVGAFSVVSYQLKLLKPE
ncbi:cell division protein FtsX [methanotrophic bacterial endosymbiont of Bathymodiolus sp.]|jgi:cell division transport system permease protein|nr:cell division protein FtsX [methanotrophic bacterial endosymbiont of Bathymodiolus sp.]